MGLEVKALLSILGIFSMKEYIIVNTYSQISPILTNPVLTTSSKLFKKQNGTKITSSKHLNSLAPIPLTKSDKVSIISYRISESSRKIIHATSVVIRAPSTANKLDHLVPSYFLTTVKNYFVRPETRLPIVEAVEPMTMHIIIYGL